MTPSNWFQHLVVLLSVVGCSAFVAWQGFKTLTLRGRGKLGACCAKGCDAAAAAEPAEGRASPPARVQFLPVEMLSRKR